MISTVISNKLRIALATGILTLYGSGCTTTTSNEDSGGTMYAERTALVDAPEMRSLAPETGLATDNEMAAMGTAPVTAATEEAAPALSQAALDTQLWDAARSGDSVTVTGLLQQGANPNSATESGETALHAGIAAGSLQTTVQLFNAGADISAATSNGWTPLHHAARFGHTEIANFLLQQGADANAVTNDNPPKTPMQMALDQGDLRTARLLGY